MAVERTLSIIKPDATKRKLRGKINARLEEAGLKVIAKRRLKLTAKQAEAFYAEHSARPFFNDLVSYMTSGEIVAQVLEGEDAVSGHREAMGATDPAKAAEGTIRKLFGKSIEANSVHGSDGGPAAAREIGFFFADVDLVDAMPLSGAAEASEDAAGEASPEGVA